MNATTGRRNGPAQATEAVYVAPDDVSGEAITKSLQALLPTRPLPLPRHRFTVLDTFDGRVRRSGAYLTREGENGVSRVAWQSCSGGSALATHLKQPVCFAWDFPDGPLQQLLTSVIGPRRLLAQADAEEYGSLLEVLDDGGKTWHASGLRRAKRGCRRRPRSGGQCPP